MNVDNNPTHFLAERHTSLQVMPIKHFYLKIPSGHSNTRIFLVVILPCGVLMVRDAEKRLRELTTPFGETDKM